MSTRIIIEKDGERYEVEDAEIRGDLFNEHFYVDFKKSINRQTGEAVRGWIKVKQLPPVIRTDNSKVIARLEAENAKLREAMKPVMECDLSESDSPYGNVNIWGFGKHHNDSGINFYGSVCGDPIVEMVCKNKRKEFGGYESADKWLEKSEKRIMAIVNSVNAVRTAQAIMKGGAE